MFKAEMLKMLLTFSEMCWIASAIFRIGGFPHWKCTDSSDEEWRRLLQSAGFQQQMQQFAAIFYRATLC